jgi:hypothetical protein
MPENVLFPYNTILSIHNLIEKADMVYVSDNY